MQKPIIQRINDIITRNNINVSQVSKLIGMPQNALSRQLNGVSSLQLDTVLSICEYFNEDVYWLLTGMSEIPKDVVSSDVTPRSEVDYKEKYYVALEELLEVRRELDELKTEKLNQKGDSPNAPGIVRSVRKESCRRYVSFVEMTYTYCKQKNAHFHKQAFLNLNNLTIYQNKNLIAVIIATVRPAPIGIPFLSIKFLFTALDKSELIFSCFLNV